MGWVHLSFFPFCEKWQVQFQKQQRRNQQQNYESKNGQKEGSSVFGKMCFYVHNFWTGFILKKMYIITSKNQFLIQFNQNLAHITDIFLNCILLDFRNLSNSFNSGGNVFLYFLDSLNGCFSQNTHILVLSLILAAKLINYQKKHLKNGR